MDQQMRNAKMLEALRCFLNGERVSWDEEITEAEWEDFFSLCMHHQILPMVYEAVYACPAFASVTGEKVRFLKSQVIRQVMVQSRKTEEFLWLYRKLTDEGLMPLVVKGLVCRCLYREPDYRCSGDEDVLIPRDQFENCHRIFLENGMRQLDPGMDILAEGEVPYCRQGGALHIELHKELFSSESEAYGKLNEFFAKAFERKIQLEISGVEIYTMCHTDHLLYLILHAFKHFLHSGFGIRQVCDIVVYADTYGKEIDWDYILEKCRNVHADLFAASLFDIGEKYLVFDRGKACYPKNWVELGVDGNDLLEDLLEGGVFGDSSMSRKHSSNITLQAVSESRKGKRARVSLVHSLFPERSYMERKYPWLKKYPALLPVSWMMRIVRYGRESRKMKGNDVKASIEIGTRRVDLMKKYKII
jgi:hypothetical protein